MLGVNRSNFYLFIYFFSNIFKRAITSKLYADDLQIYLHGPAKEIYNLLDMVNQDIRAVHEWMTSHKLYFNINKTKIMIIGSQYQVDVSKQNPLPQIRISDTIIPYVDTAKNLVVIFDSNLSWNRQVLWISRKVYFKLRQISHSKAMLSFGLRKQLVESLIIPIFDYCTLVMTNLTASQVAKLQKTLNSCVRFIFKLRRDVHITP